MFDLKFDLDVLKKTFNEICRAIILNEEIHVAAADVTEIPAWGPQDPLNPTIYVTFEDTDLKKFFRIVFQGHVLMEVINSPKELYSLVLDQIKHYRLEQGPGEDREKDLTYFYREFDERGSTYNNPVRIFFTACKLLKKYKDIILIPESLDTFNAWINWGDPLGLHSSDPRQDRRYIFKTRVLSNIEAGQRFPDKIDFQLKPVDFETKPLMSDPDSIKQLLGKTDEITYAAARVMREICKQLINPSYIY